MERSGINNVKINSIPFYIKKITDDEFPVRTIFSTLYGRYSVPCTDNIWYPVRTICSYLYGRYSFPCTDNIQLPVRTIFSYLYGR